MTRSKILLQLDSDPHASSFDAVVAVDAGVDHLFQYGGVDVARVEGLVHGAMFTRGGSDLARTAIFIGGSDVAKGESLLRAVKKCFFGPIRVSVLFDANGCNTTAAAAVLSAGKHIDLASVTALVLGGTGPVGQRVARLLRGCGCRVKLASRSLQRAEEVVESLHAVSSGAPAIEPVEAQSAQAVDQALQGCQILIAAGAAGVQFATTELLAGHQQLQVAIDLNAVPPLGIAGVSAQDKAVNRNGRLDYGALGVGGLKMKIHRAALERLFTANDLVMDAEEIIRVGSELLGKEKS